jgi:hypothetical protein
VNAPASGIGTLNTLTGATQTFATGTVGTDFNISSATTVHTFHLPSASATNRGALTSADWSTFNAKVGGSGTANRVSMFTAGSTIGDSVIYQSGANIGIGAAPGAFKLDVNGNSQLNGAVTATSTLGVTGNTTIGGTLSVTGATTMTSSLGVGGNFSTSSQSGHILNPYNTGAGQTGEIQFRELGANGTNHVGFKAPDSIVADKIWTLPSTDGAAGTVLSTDGSGVLSWVAGPGGRRSTSVGDVVARMGHPDWRLWEVRGSGWREIEDVKGWLDALTNAPAVDLTPAELLERILG